MNIKHIMMAGIIALGLAGSATVLHSAQPAHASLAWTVRMYTNGRDNYFHASNINKIWKIKKGVTYFNGFTNRVAKFAPKYRVNTPVQIRAVEGSNGQLYHKPIVVHVHHHSYYFSSWWPTDIRMKPLDGHYHNPNSKYDYAGGIFIDTKDLSWHKVGVHHHKRISYRRKARRHYRRGYHYGRKHRDDYAARTASE